MQKVNYDSLFDPNGSSWTIIFYANIWHIFRKVGLECIFTNLVQSD